MKEEQKTTMSVREMGRMLGLKKVDSYWLVHKGYFDTILVEGKMRVVIKSFERWYAGQVKYHKVNGDPPGERLRKESYSAQDIAAILDISDYVAYSLIVRGNMKTVDVFFQRRVPREEFEKWYAGQTRYRNAEDRKRDAEIEENSMSMPDMARLLDVPRSIVYGILASKRGRQMLEVITVAERKRITKESFDRWYMSQRQYLRPEDQPEGVPRKHLSYGDSLVQKKNKTVSGSKEIKHSSNLDYLTVDEAALMAKTYNGRINRWIKAGCFPVLRISKKLTRIPRTEFEAFLAKHLNHNKEENNGVDS